MLNSCETVCVCMCACLFVCLSVCLSMLVCLPICKHCCLVFANLDFLEKVGNLDPRAICQEDLLPGKNPRSGSESYRETPSRVKRKVMNISMLDLGVPQDPKTVV